MLHVLSADRNHLLDLIGAPAKRAPLTCLGCITKVPDKIFNACTYFSQSSKLFQHTSAFLDSHILEGGVILSLPY